MPSDHGLANLANYGEADLLRKAMQERATEPGKTVFLFAGQGAKTAGLAQLKQAQERVKAGDDAEAVRKQTGWHQGVDGEWRFELDDAKAHLLHDSSNDDACMDVWDEAGQREGGVPLASVLAYPDLFEAEHRRICRVLHAS